MSARLPMVNVDALHASTDQELAKHARLALLHLRAAALELGRHGWRVSIQYSTASELYGVPLVDVKETLNILRTEIL